MTITDTRPAGPAAEPHQPTNPGRRRRWPRRLLIGLDVFVAICLLGACGLYAYVGWRFGQIHRISLPGLTIGRSAAGQSAGPAGPPMNILLVGSDSRAALTDGKQFGGSAVAGARSDTIMILHLDPASTSASLLSIPRDLYVPIPGHGKNRINIAFDTGPNLLVQTIQQDLGIEINHFVDVDFDTFRQVVTAVGGLKFWYPEPVRDNDNGVNDSGLNITTPGCYTLDGATALSLVRTRHLQYEDNGRWIFEGQSDLARIRRQQLFIKKMISKAESLGVTDVASINGVVGGVVKNLTVDTGFSQSQMISLARRYKNFNAGALPSATLPTTAAVIGGADVLLLDQSQAPTVIDAWQGITPPVVTGGVTAGSTTIPAPASTSGAVQVGVLNGSGRSHQASEAAQALRNAGFSAFVSGTGAAPNFGYQTTTIEYAPGDEGGAASVQADIVGGAQLQVDATLSPGHVLVITGASYGGVQPGVTPTTPAASPTTAPPGANPAATAGALATAPGNTSNAPAFPGPHGQDPPPPGSGC